jgi:hypothetical protein
MPGFLHETARVLDQDHIRFSTLEFECERPQLPATQDGCPNENEYEFIVTIPGMEPGLYDLSDPMSGVTVQQIRSWANDPIYQVECECDGYATDGEQFFESGTVELDVASPGNWVLHLQLDALGYSGINPVVVDEVCD